MCSHISVFTKKKQKQFLNRLGGSRYRDANLISTSLTSIYTTTASPRLVRTSSTLGPTNRRPFSFQLAWPRLQRCVLIVIQHITGPAKISTSLS